MNFDKCPFCDRQPKKVTSSFSPGAFTCNDKFHHFNYNNGTIKLHLLDKENVIVKYELNRFGGFMDVPLTDNHIIKSTSGRVTFQTPKSDNLCFQILKLIKNYHNYEYSFFAKIKELEINFIAFM